MKWATFVKVTEGSSLCNVVSKALACSEETAMDLIRFGSVYHKSASAHTRLMREILPEKIITPGSYCRIHPNPLRYTQRVKEIDWKARVIEETDDFVVIDKPAGVHSCPAVDNLYECVPECLKSAGIHGYALGPTLKSKSHISLSTEIADKMSSMRPEEMQPYLQVLHRLDIDTSGIMVLSKCQKFTSTYNKQLLSQSPMRVYRAMIACSSNTRLPAGFSLVPPVGQSLEHLLLVTGRSPKEYILPLDQKREDGKYKFASSQVNNASPLVSHRLVNVTFILLRIFIEYCIPPHASI